MVHVKTSEEIEIMREGGQRLKAVVKKLLPKIKIGVTTNEIDKEAERLLKEEGAESSFNKVKGYHWSTCLPINDQVVHTPPSDRKLIDGDVLTLDIGAYYKGFHTDWATTIIIGTAKNKSDEQFLEAGKEALNKALKKVKAGGYLGDISKAIQEVITGKGYFIMKDLTGHGVGRELHEAPYIPGYLDRPVDKTMKIKPGFVLAVEVIYSAGTEVIDYEKGNGWSITTKDGSLSACFEETVAVTNENSFILT